MGFIKDLFSSPKAPTSKELTEAQNASNRQTQAMNLAASRTGQQTPFGSLTYNQSGTDQFGNPTYTATTALSEDRQKILDAVQGTAGTLAGNMSSAYGELPDFSNAAGSLTTQMLERQLAYLSPYFEQQTNNLDATLRNQGLLPGTPAYDNAMRTVRQNQNESVGQFLNQAQGQAFNQAVRQYEVPIESMGKFIGQANNLGNIGTIATPSSDMSAPETAKFMQDQYKAELDARNQAWGAVAGLGSAVLGGVPGTLAGNIGGGLSGLMGFANSAPPTTLSKAA